MADQFAEFFNGSPQQYWGIPNSYASLNQFFPGPDQSFVNQLEEKPNQPQQPSLENVGPREMALLHMTGDPLGTLELAKKIKTDREGTALLRELAPLDPTNKEYPSQLTKLLGKYTYGAQSPSIDRLLNLKTLTARHANETKYDDEVSSLAKKFALLDETDPDFDKKSAEILSSASEGAYSHPRFDSMVERVKHYASQAKSRRTLDQQQEASTNRELVKHGLKPEDYEDFSGKQEALADIMAKNSQRKELMTSFKELPPQYQKEFLDARNGIHERPTDQEKMDAVGVADPTKMTPSLWKKGFDIEMDKKTRNASRAGRNLQFFMGTNPFEVSQESPEQEIPKETVGKQAPESLYTAPSEEEAKQAQANKSKADVGAAQSGLVDALDEAIATHYNRSGLTVGDAARDIDSTFKDVDLDRGETHQESIDSFLNNIGVPPSPNTRQALTDIFQKRNTSRNSSFVLPSGVAVSIGTPVKKS